MMKVTPSFRSFKTVDNSSGCVLENQTPTGQSSHNVLRFCLALPSSIIRYETMGGKKYTGIQLNVLIFVIDKCQSVLINEKVMRDIHARIEYIAHRCPPNP